MPVIILTRPTESNSGLSSSAPTKLLTAKTAMYQPVCLTPRNVRQGVAVGEEERVVEERLADEEREAEHRPLRVEREDGLRDQRDADRLALPDRDRLGDVVRAACRSPR